jgi:hypothetical protein
MGRRRGGKSSHRVVGFWFMVVFGVLFLGWGAGRIVNGILFNIHCKGHLKRAADSNTVELAKRELRTALSFLESNDLTDGYTSIIYQTPDEDIEFWYTNINSALTELKALPKDSSPLEKTNVLMKLRETLCDVGEKGIKLTVPDGISIYPRNASWAFVGSLSAIGTLVGFLLWFFGLGRDGVL